MPGLPQGKEDRTGHHLRTQTAEAIPGLDLRALVLGLDKVVPQARELYRTRTQGPPQALMLKDPGKLLAKVVLRAPREELVAMPRQTRMQTLGPPQVHRALHKDRVLDKEAKVTIMVPLPLRPRTRYQELGLSRIIQVEPVMEMHRQQAEQHPDYGTLRRWISSRRPRRCPG